MPTDSVVDTLFGPQPWQIQQQQNQRMQDFAHQQAGMNAAQRSVQAMTNAGGLLGGVAMEGMGYVNPAIEEAKRREAIMSMPGDLTTAAGLKAKAAQFAQAGDQATALKLVMLAKQREEKDQETALKRAQELAALHKANAEASPLAKIDPSKYTQDSMKVYVAGGMKDPSVLVSAEKPQFENAPTSVKEYEYAKEKDGFKGSYSDWLKSKAQATHISLNMNGAGSLTQGSADTAIDLALAGDPSMMIGWGRSPKDKAAIINRITERMKSGEITPQQFAVAKAQMAGYMAGERVVGTQGANIQLSANEANQMMGVVRSVMPEVKLTDYPSLNILKNAVDKQLGGPAVPKLYASLNALVNTYARAINPRGVATVHDKTKAETMINTAMANGQLEGVMQVMKQEMDAALASPGMVRSGLAEERTGTPAAKQPIQPPKQAVRKYNPATGRIE